ncbi:MAG: MarC family protein [Thermoplasmatota archaeon]
MIDLVATFIVFFAVIDPIGTVPVFIAMTRTSDRASRQRIAIVAVLAAAAILLFFLVAGELVLAQLGIPLDAFQIAGGIILFLFALTMIFGSSKPEEEMALIREDKAIFPLAMPSIASPGAILAAVLLTENARVSFLEQLLVATVMLGVLVVQLGLLLGAAAIHRFIGDAGASVISRVMGMLLAAVATTHVVTGIQGTF